MPSNPSLDPSILFYLLLAKHHLISPPYLIYFLAWSAPNECKLCHDGITSGFTVLLNWNVEYRGVSDVGFGSCPAPTFYYSVRVFQKESRVWDSEVNLDNSIALFRGPWIVNGI